MSENKSDRDKTSERVCKGLCKISRGDRNTINCFRCELVQHTKCSGLTKEQLEAINPNDQSGLVYLCRMCLVTCKNDTSSTQTSTINDKKLNELKEHINTLSSTMNKRLSDIENKMETNQPNPIESDAQLSATLGKFEEALCNKVDNMEKTIITSYAEKVSKNISENSNQIKVMTEISKQVDGLNKNLNSKFAEENNTKIEEKLIEAKKNNICIFNLPESKQIDEKAAYQDDITKLKLMFSNKVLINSNDVKEVYRKGDKSKTYPRIIIMKLSTYEKKSKYLN